MATFKTVEEGIKESLANVHPPWKVIWQRVPWRRVSNADTQARNRRPTVDRNTATETRNYWRPKIPRIIPRAKSCPANFLPFLTMAVLLYYEQGDKICRMFCRRDDCPEEKFRSRYVLQPCRPEVRRIRQVVHKGHCDCPLVQCKDKNKNKKKKCPPIAFAPCSPKT
ncbi:uncharacterized protein LOC106012117 [Aplysia californica]|uniref:Uncharacterized protein LOC106012117 n=1 Tax=Aplysia californica TaxID=6500 RepID=A0ABM1A2C2_APLCA|nr:uncharacterized protein LOC106012117 [Aplysia californica]